MSLLKARTPVQLDAADAPARFAVSAEGFLLYANESFCALTGIEADQNSKIDVLSLLRFADPAARITDVSPGVHTVFLNDLRQPLEFHFDWLSAGGGKRYLVGSGDAATALSDDEMGTFAVKIQQISRQKYDKIEENPENFGHFLTLSRDMMLVLAENGSIEHVSSTFHDQLGYSRDDIRELSFFDLIENEDRPYVRNVLQSFASAGEAYGRHTMDFEARAHTKTYETRIIEWRLEESEGKFFCLGRDVTDIKQQKLALERRKSQLAEAEAIGRMGHWHWKVGEDNIDWSEEIFRIFGVKQGEYNPSLHQLDQMVHRRDIGRVVHAFQRAIIERNNYDMDFRIKRPDGEIRFIRCEGRCQKDGEGEVIALYGIMQDMTERMLYEKQLHEAKDAAERAYAAKSQFLANMSHELRTPLNAIIGFSEMMQRQLLGPIGTEKYLDYIGGIRESGEHLLDLISDILDMSKIEAGKYELDLEEVSVPKTIRLAAHMMQARAEEAKVNIIAEALGRDNLNIIADRRAFMQIMLNLMSNAVKFTKKGGEVRIECTERGDSISLKVIDTGIGIPANKLASITRPFEQVSSSYSREHEGSGLGLAITKELAEMHGGNLQIESTVGVGTIVTIRLPMDASKKK
mgnify:CR=1 FL=1